MCHAANPSEAAGLIRLCFVTAVFSQVSSNEAEFLDLKDLRLPPLPNLLERGQSAQTLWRKRG